MTPPARSFRHRLLSLDLDAFSDRELVGMVAVVTALLSALAWSLLSVFVPAPASGLALTSGPTTGSYHLRAQRFAAAMQRAGVAVQVRPSRGTPENLDRLGAGEAGAQAGFVQGGIADLSQLPHLESLGRLGYEPVWVFYRRDMALHMLAGLKGRRVSVGAAGGGSQPVARVLLQAGGIGANNAELVEYGNDDALAALDEGRIDAFFSVAAWDAPVIQRALHAGHGLLHFSQAAALSRQFPWLTALVLPRGGLSLESDRPPADVELVAVNTELVVRSDLHSATKALLRRVAHEDQRRGMHSPLMRATSLAAADTMPDGARVEVPFLQNHLPFWWAEGLQRLSLSVLPVLLVALPALNALLTFRQRRRHSHILRLFAQAKELQLRVSGGPRMGGQARSELSRLEHELQRLSPQVVHLVDYYRLRSTLAALTPSSSVHDVDLALGDTQA